MTAKTQPVIVLLSCAGCLWICSSCGPSQQQRVQNLCEAGTHNTQSGSPEKALPEFSEAISLDPKSVPAYMGRGTARYALQDVAGAATDYSTVIDLDPTNEQAFLFRAECRYTLKDFTGAMNDLNEAVELDPHDAKALYARGTARIRQRDWDGAAADFTAAIQVKPNDEIAYRNRAAIELKQKDYEKALADASQAIELNSADPAVYYIRAHAKSILKDHDGAIADADKAVELNPSETLPYTTRGGIKVLWNDFPGASNDFESAINIDPNNPNVYTMRAVLEWKQGNIDAALADLNRSIDMAPASFESAEVYEELGHLDDVLFLWRPALEQFHRALAADPTKDYLYFKVFLIRSRLGETNEAQKEFNAYVLAIPPAKSGDWTTTIAHFLAGSVDEKELIDQATKSAKRPTDISGQLCEAYYYAGVKHLLAGDKTGAAELFQKAVDTKEDNFFEFRSARSELNALKNPKSSN
jgi:tetratricopeptide (TPR) repeat protein